MPVLIAAPNAMITRVVVDAADPFYWNMMRYAVIVVAVTPFIVGKLRLFRVPCAAKALVAAG